MWYVRSSVHDVISKEIEREAPFHGGCGRRQALFIWNVAGGRRLIVKPWRRVMTTEAGEHEAFDGGGK